MKQILFFFFVLQVHNSQGQLVRLFNNENTVDKDKNMLFYQFNFKVVYDEDDYSISSLKNDSSLYKPKKQSFYETFGNKFLLSTIKNRNVIPIGNSTPYCEFPRKVTYIIPIDSIQDLNFIYFVDFKNKIVLEDVDYGFSDRAKLVGYKIRVIDLKKMKLVLYDKNGKAAAIHIKRQKYLVPN